LLQKILSGNKLAKLQIVKKVTRTRIHLVHIQDILIRHQPTTNTRASQDLSRLGWVRQLEKRKSKSLHPKNQP